MIRAAVLSLMLLSAPVLAQSRQGFVAGPVLPDVGPIAPVDSDLPLPKGAKFKIDFDIAAKATPGTLSRQIETAARTLNMHVAAGVPQKDVQIVLIFHGPSAVDPALHLRAARRGSLQAFFLAQQACVVATAWVGPLGVQAGHGGAGQLHAG